jgi:hypothetical protein
MTKRITIALRAIGLVVVAGTLAAGAWADDNGAVLISTLIGSTPNQVIGGVNSGGLPWNVAHGQVTLHRNGKLNMELDGLVLASLGTPGPITQVSASLVCGGSGGTVAGTTAAVSLTVAGNAHIHDKVSVPSSCIAPVILVRVGAVNGTPLAQPGAFIAATGFNNTSAENEPDKHDSADRF